MKSDRDELLMKARKAIKARIDELSSDDETESICNHFESKKLNKANLIIDAEKALNDFIVNDHDWYASDVLKEIMEVSKMHMSNKGIKKLIKLFQNGGSLQ